MRRALIGLAAVAALAVAVPLLALLALDTAPVRTRIAAAASARLGRPVTVGGLTLAPGATLSLTARDVTLGNAPWGRDPHLLRLARLEVDLAAASLLDGPLRVRRVAADGLDLRLEQAADGARNWDLGGPDDGDWTWLEELPVVIEDVTLAGSRITVAAPRLARPITVALDAVDQRLAGDGQLVLTVRGRANAEPLAVRGRLGPVAGLLTGRDFAIDLGGSLGAVRFRALLAVDDLAAPRASRLTVRAAAPDARYLLERFGIPGLGDGPVDLEVRLTPLAGGTAGFDAAARGQVGELAIAGFGRVTEPAGAADLALDLAVSGPDLALLGDLAGIPGIPAEPFRLRLAGARTDGAVTIRAIDLEHGAARLVATGRVGDWDRFADTDLHVVAAGADATALARLAGLPQPVSGPYALRGQIRRDAGTSEAVTLTGVLPFARLAADGTLGPAPAFHGTRLRLELAGADLAALGRALGTALPRGSFTAAGDLGWTASGLDLIGTRGRHRDVQLQLDGRVGGEPLGSSAELRFDIAGPNLTSLRPWVAADIDWAALPRGRYRGRGSLRLRPGEQRLQGASLDVAGHRIELSGRLGQGAGGAGTDVTFRLAGPDLAALRTLAGRPNLPAGAYRAGGGLVLTANRARLRDVDFAVAGASGRVTASVARPDPLAAGQLDLDLRGPDLAALLPDLGTVRPSRDPFTLAARGSWTGDRWNVDRGRLVSGTTRIELGASRGTGLAAGGTAAGALALRVESADLAATGRLLGLALPAVPLSLAGRFNGNATGVAVSDITGRLGGTDFGGRASLALRRAPRQRPRVDIALTSTAVDLDGLLALVPAGDGPVAAAAATGPGNRRIPATPLPLDLLDTIDGRITWSAQRLGSQGDQYRDVRLAAGLAGGELALEQLEIASARGRLSATGGIRRPPGAPEVTLALTAEDVLLEPPSPATAGAPRYAARFAGTARGRDLRELARTLTGRLRVTSTGGSVANSRAAAVFSGFYRDLFEALNPFAKRTQRTEIACVALLLAARDGTLRTAPAVVVRTAEIDVVGTGSVNLASEAIDFNFKTAARRGIGISAGDFINPYIKVSGSLARPRLTLDPKGALVNGGAAFATLGISVVATTLWDRVTRSRDPCGEALAAAEAEDPPATTRRRGLPAKRPPAP
jgi:hypothetical protein